MGDIGVIHMGLLNVIRRMALREKLPIVSARSLPYAAMLDGWLKHQGMRSSMALFG